MRGCKSPLICPTCGCSLVRLGIAPVPALTFRFRDFEYFFCCADCRDLFVDEPERYLRETDLWKSARYAWPKNQHPMLSAPSRRAASFTFADVRTA